MEIGIDFLGLQCLDSLLVDDYVIKHEVLYRFMNQSNEQEYDQKQKAEGRKQKSGSRKKK